MHTARKMTAIAGATLSALLLAGLLLVPSSAARAGPPEPRELTGLREAPDIPVGSIFLRRALPGHPLPPAVEREFPGPDAPGVEGRPPPGGGGCDKDVDLDPTGVIGGVVNVAAQDNGICTNADIDTYVDMDGYTYVVQAGGEEAAWTHTDVSDPVNPVFVDQFVWDGPSGRNTYTPDLKTFSQGIDDYIVMGLERMKVRAFCGVIIVKVTDPANPVIMSQYMGNTTNQNLGPAWCDTHNVFVEKDLATGEGKYIYATADGPNDLRVLDISGAGGSSVTNPIEIGRYVAPGADNANNSNYVHDVTVLYHSALAAVDEDGVVVDDGRRVYLSYWASGLIILKAADVTPGTTPVPVVGPNMIPDVNDHPDFLTHHAWASEDGSVVFIQDEIMHSVDDEPVQMWTVPVPDPEASTPENPSLVDSLVLGTDLPINPAHNLEIRYDIDPNRLYVAWYKLGLQAWDFTTGTTSSDGFDRNYDPPFRADLYHQVQTETADGEYDGAWGVRLEWIMVGATNFLYIFQSDRNFGLIVDCVGCSEPATGTVTGTVTDIDTSQPIMGASVMTDTGQSDTTDINGDYELINVPVGTRTVTASATSYVTLPNTDVGVTDDATTDGVDFALDAEATGGGTGTIKGTVTDASTGAGLSGVLVETDLGESAITNRRGKYNIKNVPEGPRLVTASKSGYVTQMDLLAEVTAGQTTTLNIALMPDS